MQLHIYTRCKAVSNIRYCSRLVKENSTAVVRDCLRVIMHWVLLLLSDLLLSSLSISVSLSCLQHFQCRLKQHSTKIGVRAVILAPTRELALQTYTVVKKMGHGLDLRTAVLVGGDALTGQFMQLAANPDIMVSTPG